MTFNPAKYTLVRSAMRSVKVEVKSAEILTTVQKRLSISKKGSSSGIALKPFSRSIVKEIRSTVKETSSMMSEKSTGEH